MRMIQEACMFQIALHKARETIYYSGVLNKDNSETKATIKRILKLLTKKDKIRLQILLVFQLLSSLLDLLGIFLIGIIGSLTINGIQSKGSSPRISSILETVNLDQLSFQNQIAVLGSITGFVFIFRTLASLYFTRATLNFLAARSARISSNLIKNVLQAPFERIKHLHVQEVIYGSTFGVDSLVLRIVGSLLICIADIFLLFVILVGLTVYSVSLSITLIVIFGTVSYLSYISLSKQSYELGLENARLNVFTGAKLSEALKSYRELYVRDRIGQYSTILGQSRIGSAKTNAGAALLPNISKYTIEAAVVLGTLLIAATQFAIEDANSAITGMAVYLAAASRVAPGALRIQQGFLTVKNNIGPAQITLQIYDEFSNSFPANTDSKPVETSPESFKGEVSVKNINFNYADSEVSILNKISLEIKSGTMVALVGASGMGKSTFVDLILGIISPTSGEITISGVVSNNAVKKWPGAIAYVPQNISIINGTIKENITLGYLPNEISENEIKAALISAQLDEFVDSLPGKENTIITENGQNLSGGQKQKIGIARALLSNPGLIILDEATSSLDSRSEFEIMKVINNLRNKVTLIIVAHRLSTVKDADQIIYFGANTHVVAANFTDLANNVADFKEQASLLGL